MTLVYWDNVLTNCATPPGWETLGVKGSDMEKRNHRKL